MTLRVAARIARRELRGGLAGFRIFLLCLTLGVTAIAAVGMVRAAIEAGLTDQGAVILGGDAEMEFTYRRADATERAWMADTATGLSEVIDFRSMAVVGAGTAADRGLTQVKAVDAAYPLVGAVVLDPVMPLATALDGSGDLPGAVMQRGLIDRLGLAVGDTFQLGVQTFRLTAVLVTEPDASSAGFGLGPRTIVRASDLDGSGLLSEGTLFDAKYRLSLPEGTDLAALEVVAETRFRDAGMRWRDSRNGAPGVQRFVERIGAFLVLVGLAGLAVGGVGISASVRAYLAGKTGVIAVLKTLGADRATIFATYLIQVGVLTVVGVTAGVVLGAALPLALAPLIQAQLPVPVAFGVFPAPLLEAALYGTLTALIFVLWPLAQTERVRPAALFRGTGPGDGGWPRLPYLAVIAGLLLLLVGAAALFSGVPGLALWTAGGIAGALAVLALAARGLRWMARRLSRSPVLRGRPALRLALAAVGGPDEAAVSVVLSLGLGLTVLAAVGQIDTNLRSAIQGELPAVAPSYFFVDIQPDQIDGFRDRLDGDAGVSRTDTAAMLRGVITKINGRPAREVAGDHWVVRGDRGLTYSATPPPRTIVTQGAWWPEDYTGPPQMSFAEEEALEIGLKLGDRVTVNVLGREIEAEVTSFRVVDFSTAGIGFVMTMNPAALAGAPHTYISTVYADEATEAAVLRDLATAYPNITAIRVRDAIDNVAGVLAGIAAATSYGAAATLLTGFVVLIGAAAAGERGRIYEAAILKTLGATRGRILGSFALRSALLGGAAGLVALAAGAAAGWGVMTYVMDAPFALAWGSALTIILGGVLATLISGLAFAWRPLAVRPARILRNQD
ncbi:ABC transporter permease [Pseudoruegeria sp. SK021]|uniref:ABC transporter permease n=1 Tax=Pseudoruegeria sp. SK021 TaxID=1933035 RepID=UPI000A244F81|nr:FtsX-like permease family protein [Pseudoruegeria sp. SK021]OSP54519.1 drug:proton antiporter [Pseudoruegeria sp. SK021]